MYGTKEDKPGQRDSFSCGKPGVASWSTPSFYRTDEGGEISWSAWWKEELFDELCQRRGPIYSSEGDMSENICEQQYSLIPKPSTKMANMGKLCWQRFFLPERKRDVVMYSIHR